MEHISVLLRESVDALNVKPDGAYIDATFGLGGHSAAILQKLSTGRLVAFDLDRDAPARLKPQFAASNFSLISANFRDMDAYAAEPADGILFDLGVSSPQLDDAGRGFSFRADAPLDMRMDQTQSLTAHTIANDWEYADLCRILREYGEETRYAPLIARAIIKNRPVDTTAQLAELVKRALPAKALRSERHPAIRAFQAFRIAVNDELGALSEGLEKAHNLLKPGGRLVVISFHSLEDRIVKDFIKGKTDGCKCPSDFPECVCGFAPTLRNITKKPITPAQSELADNNRAHSAKMRVAERI